MIVMKWKKATIFISSTFNDMHAERDYLIKEVFPELREWCEERKILFIDIDLRWGVTEDDSNNNATVRKCLEHIDKSRPFFICFLGQRRGWIPKNLDEETLLKFPESQDWLDEHISVTEMEIEHALLKPMQDIVEDSENYNPTKHNLFFFRDSDYLKYLTDYQRLIYTNDKLGKDIDNNGDIIDLNDSETKINQANEELSKFIQKIKDKKEKESEKNKSREKKNRVNVELNDYTGQWDESLEVKELMHDDFTHGEFKGRLTEFSCDGQPLAEVIKRQLKEQIALEFPENMVIDELSEKWEKDLAQQDIFTFINSEGYIKNGDYIEKLSEYLSGENNEILLLTSEAGYGKTMLLAKLTIILQEKYKEKKHIYKRFCGSTDLSSKIFTMWKSIIDEAGISTENEFYPSNLDDLKRNINDILQIIAQEDSIIIIDAVNQLPNGMDMLKWFTDRVNINDWPENLKNNLKIIFSIKEDTDTEFTDELKNIVKKENIKSIKLEGFDNKEKKVELIRNFLNDYLKELSIEQIEHIFEIDGSNNPLFLKILLSEIRLIGSYEELNNNFEDIISQFGNSPLEAFNRVLDRLEEDERDNEANGIIPLMFSLLANARIGLSNEELVNIIHNEKPELENENIEDMINVTIRQIRSFMTRKEGRHDFFYESFKLASHKRYISNKKEHNKLLADYYDNEVTLIINNNSNYSGEKIRPFNELTYHLKEAGEERRLEEVVSNYQFIKNKFRLSDVYNVIGDYEKFNEVNDDNPQELIGRALELSAFVLMEDESQLPAQLWGRLNGIDDEVIKNLLKNIEEDTNDKWLKSTKNALYSPKSSIIKIIKAGGKKTTALKISKDKKIIIGNKEGTLSIYDLNDNSLEKLEQGNSEIIKIILSDDETEIIVANKNGLIKKWNINKLTKVEGFDFNFNVEITDIYHSKTYNKIYASSHTGIYSIDLETGHIKTEHNTKKEYNFIKVPKLMESILVADEKEVDGWNVYNPSNQSYNKNSQLELSNYGEELNEELATRLGASADIRFMGLFKRFLLLITENSQMKMWNTLQNSATHGEIIDQTFTTSLNDKFSQAIILEHKKQIITLSDMGLLRVWQVPEPIQPTFRDIKNIQTNISSPTSIEYYVENNWVLIGNKNNEISIIDLNKNIEEVNDIIHKESVLSIKINDNYMITSSTSGEVFIWNDEEKLSEYSTGFRNECISYNFEEDKLICGGFRFDEDGKIENLTTKWKTKTGIIPEGEKISDRLIDIAQNSSGELYLYENKMIVLGQEFKFNEGVATTFSSIFNSSEVFIGFKDGKICKYSDKLENFDQSTNSPVLKIIIANDNVISGYANGEIKILDLKGKILQILKEHTDEVVNLTVYNGKLISVSKDKTLKIWDIGSGECIYTYFLNIFGTSINILGGKLVVGDILGNINFFEFENF